MSLAASESAQATIVFIDGDRLSGQVSDVTNETFTFVGTVTGTLSIKWNLVKKVEFGNQAVVVTTSAAKFPSTLALAGSVIRAEQTSAFHCQKMYAKAEVACGRRGRAQMLSN